MNATLPRQSIVTASSHQVSADLSTDQTGNIVILDLRDGIYYEVTHVGALVWRLLSQPRSIGELLESVLAEYDVAEERCLQDIGELLTDLQQRGLVAIQPT